MAYTSLLLVGPATFSEMSFTAGRKVVTCDLCPFSHIATAALEEAGALKNAKRHRPDNFVCQ
jgi:hypothetical protein